MLSDDSPGPTISLGQYILLCIVIIMLLFAIAFVLNQAVGEDTENEPSTPVETTQ